MKNSTAIAVALWVAITARVPAYAQNAQSPASPSGGVLEIPPASPPPPDPTTSDSFKDDDAAIGGDPSVAAFPPASLSSGNSSTAPAAANDAGIAENDQNLAQSDLPGAKDSSYPGVSEYLNQQSDYASYASAYSGLPSAALIGPSPLIRYMVLRSVMVSSFPPPTVLGPIPMRPFGPGFGPPVFRYYAPPPGPRFGAFGGRGFGGRVGFSHR